MGATHASARSRVSLMALLAIALQPTAPAQSTVAALDLPRATMALGGDEAAQGGPATQEALLKAAHQAVTKHADALGVESEQALIVQSVHAGKHGPAVVTFRQTIKDMEVVGARISVALDGAANVRAITGGFSPNSKTLEKTTFKLDAVSAIQALVKNSGISGAKVELKALEPRNGYEYFMIGAEAFRALRPARIKPVLYPAEGRLIAAYYTELVGRRAKQTELEGWGSIVSAEDGALLRHESLIDEAVHSYRVFAQASGAPLVDAYGHTFPHPTAWPDGWRPTSPAAMRMITLDHAGLSSGDPWLPTGATHTVGNNVDAYFNSLRDDGGIWNLDGDGPFTPSDGDFRAPLSSAGVFDYAYDVGSSVTDYVQLPGNPATPIPSDARQLNAKIVQAFYANNWLHDLFYDLGFDEAAGNAQKDNFGRGGLAGDPLIVNAGFYATYVYTPADGESPVMRLGVNAYSGTRRDVSAFDFSVIAHEWGHTLFRRLTGFGFGGQQGALNEGTADFIGVLLNVHELHRDAAPASSPFSGAYAFGAYSNLDYDFPGDPLPAAGSPGYPDNTYYHGVRRYPYSADTALNPLTLRHIAYGNTLPASPARFDWKFRSLVNSEVHSAGEVWASALWQCASNILADETRFTFEERKQRVLAYLVAGLKLFPADADFIEARNAILFAIRAADRLDYILCHNGFALRGFGAGALAPDRYSVSNRGVIESFSRSDAALSFIEWRLEEVGGGDGDGVLDVGEQGRLWVTVRNTGLVPLERVRVYVPHLTWAYTFPSGSTAYAPPLEPNDKYTVAFDVRIVTTLGAQMVGFNLTAGDLLRTDAKARQDALFTVNYDLVRDAHADWLISPKTFEANWTLGFERRHGCAMVCLGDLTNWQWSAHLGEHAYRIGSEHISLDAHLTTNPFTLYPAAPFRIVFTHDYDFSRADLYGGSGAEAEIEISVAGGPWENVRPYLVSGGSHYFGTSGGWRTDTLDFGNALGGRTVQLRWRMIAESSFGPQPVHWALSRISIAGASTPMFSSVRIDVD